MSLRDHDPSDRATGDANWFATTHWSVVLAAGHSSAPGAQKALEQLCQTYWPPLYAYIRRNGHDATEAQDLTQEFFAQFLARDYLGHLRHQRGKFRSFLLTFVKHFLCAERAKARAQKRGGGKLFVSLDACSEEEQRLIEILPDLSAEQVFERRWAQTVLDRSLQNLRVEYERKGKGALFDALKDVQPGEHGERTYAELGGALNMTEDAVKTAVSRMRRRHGEILRKEIANTLARVEDLEEELRHLLAVLRR